MAVIIRLYPLLTDLVILVHAEARFRFQRDNALRVGKIYMRGASLRIRTARRVGGVKDSKHQHFFVTKLVCFGYTC
jgi:hypothetical protein